MSEYLLKNGTKLYYEDTGHGQPVVFLHGWSSSHSMFSLPVNELRGRARCITYDHRGHYGSRGQNTGTVTLETLADDLNELITGLQLTGVTLVGWSMGAGTALTYIRRYGCSALKQIVLCDMTPKVMNDENWKLGLFSGKFTEEDTSHINGKDFLTLYKEFAVSTSPSLAELTRAELDHNIEAKLSNLDVPVLKQLAVSMKKQDNRDAVGMMTVPFTYFYAVPGSVFAPELAEWYREHAVSPFRAVGFRDSSHKLITEHPDLFAAEIGKLL